jgi:hypothetical protein
MKHPTFEKYILEYTSSRKVGPRSACLEYLTEQIVAGTFPGPTSSFRACYSRWIKTIPQVHVREAGRLIREYEQWKKRRVAEAHAQKRLKALDKLNAANRPKPRKTYSLMDLIR